MSETGADHDRGPAGPMTSDQEDGPSSRETGPDGATDSDVTDLRAMAEATADLIAALDAIEEGDWKSATPCPDWDLADLVDHVAGGNWFTIGILAGMSSADAMQDTMARFERGSATADSAARSATDQLSAFEQDRALHRTYQHVAGDLPGRQVLRLRAHDVIVHTWDILETLHPPAAVPITLAEWGRRELDRSDSLMAKHFEIPETARPSAPGADASSAYLRAFGR